MRFALAGDIALSGLVSSDPVSNGRRFGWLQGVLSRCDGLIANLETPVVADERNSSKRAFLYADAAVTRELLKRLNVVCVSLANNHILDCGREGLANTIRLLDEEGISHAGAGLTAAQADTVIFNLAGKTIAFAAYADTSTHPGTDTYKEIYFNTFDPAAVSDDIRKARTRADIVIVSIHWGSDYSFYYEHWQALVARELIDAGADIIMGHHSHTLQSFEAYRSGHIFYGLGSLVFGDFMRNGRMYALFRKTKRSAIIFMGDDCVITEAVATREKKGNVIVTGGRDVIRRNRRLTAVSRLRVTSRPLRALLDFREKIIDRVYEYFFGYYMHPVRRLFQFRNIRKAGRLLK
jgi:hypothetical protein